MNPQLQFVIPDSHVLDDARQLLDSQNQDERDIAKALLETTKLTITTEKNFRAGKMEQPHLGPYFDHSIGDTLDMARRLFHSDDKKVSRVARLLIDQMDAIKQSKAAFFLELKRLQKWVEERQ